MNNNNMYAMLLFLLVITTMMSSVLCSSSANINDDKEILMVVEEIQTSSMEQQGMAQNPTQPGPFNLRGGMSVTLLSLVNGRENTCVPPGDTCGAADWCCEGSECQGVWRWFSGTCVALPNCVKNKGDWCNLGNRCCYPYQCTSPKDGYCD